MGIGMIVILVAVVVLVVYLVRSMTHQQSQTHPPRNTPRRRRSRRQSSGRWRAPATSCSGVTRMARSSVRSICRNWPTCESPPHANE